MISLFCDLGFLVINGDLTSQTRERQGAAIYWDWSEGEWELLLIHSSQRQLPSCNLACNLTFLAQVVHFCLQTYFIHIMSVDTVDCTLHSVHWAHWAHCAHCKKCNVLFRFWVSLPSVLEWLLVKSRWRYTAQQSNRRLFALHCSYILFIALTHSLCT